MRGARRRIAGRPAVLLLALAALAAAPAPAQVVIDSFTTIQATISDPPGGASNVATAGADILGQRRGLRVRRFAGAGPVSAGVAGGELDLSVAATTPDSNGAVFVTWDGDSDPNVLNPTGLGGVDLTAGGAGAFRFTISQAVAGTSLVLEVYEDADSVSRGGVVLPLIAAPVDIFVDFSSLATAPGAATPADLTFVGAIVLRVEADEATPAVLIDQIVTAVPEIAALKVDRTPAGDPIPGSVAPGDTIRYRITISNTGGGAAGVELTDVLDPNLALVAGSVRTTPLARPDVYRTVTDQPIDSSAAALPALLDNDVDPDGDALAAVPVTGQGTSQGGSVDVAADGHFVYTPPVGFNGVDDFAYTIAATAGDPTVDASGAPIGPIQARARIVIDRAPPVVTAGGTLAYTENDAATAIDPALTVTDADSVNLVSATVQITGNYQNGEDVLSFANTPNITGVFTPATGTLSLDGLDTVANWQTALRSVAYENTSEDPDESDRTVTWIASDGVESSAPATSTIEVTAVNDPPAVTTSGGATSFVEDAGAVAVDGALTVTDADDTDLVSATVTLTNPQDGAQESLAVAAPAATCPGLVVSAPGHALSITGTATVAVYQGCLRSVLYADASQNPTALPDRLVTFVANDGDDPSNTAQKTVTVTPVNDPPVVTGESFQTISNTRLRVAATDPGADANGPYVFAAGNLLANDSDPDGPSPLTTSLGTATAGAVVAVSSNGTFSYTSPAGRTVDDSFTYNVSDGDVSVQGTVTISFVERVWYVRNDAAAGGLGRSIDPFDTLAEAQTASAANDWIFVYNGDGSTTGQNAGIALKAGQRLVGEGVGLSIPVVLNGGGSPVNLVAAGTRPMLDNTTVGGSGVMATDAIPAQIVGLNLAGNANAVDVTLTGGFGGSGALTIANNIVRASGAEGVDVNAGGTGTLTLAIHDNGITAGGTGLDVTRTSGTVQVTAFDDNVVSGTTGGSGLALSGPITIDATPGGAYQQVAGGVTVIGASGNGVGASGLVLNNVSGDLAFTDLDVFADNGAAIRVSGTGAVNVGAGTGTRVSVGAGVGIAEATGGPAVDLSNLTASLPLTTIRSTNTTSTGVSLVSVLDAANPAFDAQFTAGAGSTITTAAGATGPAFNVGGGNGRVNYAGTITNNSAAARAVSITTWAGDDASDDLVLSGAIDENGAGILVNGCGGSRAIRFTGDLERQRSRHRDHRNQYDRLGERDGSPGDRIGDRQLGDDLPQHHLRQRHGGGRPGERDRREQRDGFDRPPGRHRQRRCLFERRDLHRRRDPEHHRRRHLAQRHSQRLLDPDVPRRHRPPRCPRNGDDRRHGRREPDLRAPEQSLVEPGRRRQRIGAVLRHAGCDQHHRAAGGSRLHDRQLRGRRHPRRQRLRNARDRRHQRRDQQQQRHERRGRDRRRRRRDRQRHAQRLGHDRLHRPRGRLDERDRSGLGIGRCQRLGRDGHRDRRSRQLPDASGDDLQLRGNGVVDDARHPGQHHPGFLRRRHFRRTRGGDPGQDQRQHRQRHADRRWSPDRHRHHREQHGDDPGRRQQLRRRARIHGDRRRRHPGPPSRRNQDPQLDGLQQHDRQYRLGGDPVLRGRRRRGRRSGQPGPNLRQHVLRDRRSEHHRHDLAGPWNGAVHPHRRQYRGRGNHPPAVALGDSPDHPGEHRGAQRGQRRGRGDSDRHDHLQWPLHQPSAAYSSMSAPERRGEESHRG